MATVTRKSISGLKKRKRAAWWLVTTWPSYFKDAATTTSVWLTSDGEIAWTMWGDPAFGAGDVDAIEDDLLQSWSDAQFAAALDGLRKLGT